MIRVGINVDLEGWRPERGKTDKEGDLVEDRNYNVTDYDRTLVIDERTQIVAKKLTEYLKGYNRFAKTIVFCVDIDHAQRMRSALVNENPDLSAENSKYIMQITGDNEEGKRELDNFTDPEQKYPVIATTSELMTTGIDAITCKVIVLDANIASMTKFKQIIGRGTRINEDYDKKYFTIIDFRNATDLFADPDFDGEPIQIKEVSSDVDITDIEPPEVDFPPDVELPPEPPLPPDEPPEPPHTRLKVYVNGVDVSILISRELYFDQHGKLITASLKDHTREIIRGQFASLDDFINKWNSTDKKTALIEELQQQGILVEALYKAVNKELDLFDLICHVAYDMPPLTRKERAENVKKRNYFTKYGEQARKVMENLLDKYADEGIDDIESMEVLKVKPFTDFGSPVEIIGAFGSKKKYLDAIHELETELYKTA